MLLTNSNLKNIENICANISDAYLFLKDTQCRYMGANDLTLETAQQRCYQDIIGKDDKELIWHHDADQYTQNDLVVLSSNKTKIFFESMTLPNKQSFNLLTIKSPLRQSPSDKTTGILGLSIPTKQIDFHSLLITSHEVGLKLDATSLSTLYYDYFNYLTKNVELTTRERECLFFLSRGLTAKRIAKAMKISSRTVEMFIDKLKIKLKCSSKSELIEKIHSYNLLS